MSDDQEFQFDMEGGVKGVALRMLGYVLKWIAIGALIPCRLEADPISGVVRGSDFYG